MPAERGYSSGMNRTDLPIAPCEVDWSTMTLADRGRFCGSCRKVVTELTHMTEAQARALLDSPPTEGLCVRYLYDERGEIVFRSDVVLADASSGDDPPNVPGPPQPPTAIPRPSMGVPLPAKRRPTPDEQPPAPPSPDTPAPPAKTESLLATPRRAHRSPYTTSCPD
jgi:hypothetical protein